MFGKSFESTFEGTLVGRGAVTIAVMLYAIAKQRYDPRHGSLVPIQPAILAATLGEPVEKVEAALLFLCAPDKHGGSAEDGRRLVKVAEFQYRVVDGAKYRKARATEIAQWKKHQKRRNARDVERAKEAVLAAAKTPPAEAAPSPETQPEKPGGPSGERIAPEGEPCTVG